MFFYRKFRLDLFIIYFTEQHTSDLCAWHESLVMSHRKYAETR